MKKLFSLLFTSMIFLSINTFGQFSNTVIRVDTIAKPTAFKFGMNKLNDKYMFWDKASWKYIPTAFHDTATLNFPSTTSTTVSDLTKTIPGVALGMGVALGVPNGSQTATGSFSAWVSAANTVTIRYSPKATEDPASGVFDISVFKY